MVKQLGFWDVEERLREISAHRDPLEMLAVAAEVFPRVRRVIGPVVLLDVVHDVLGDGAWSPSGSRPFGIGRQPAQGEERHA